MLLYIAAFWALIPIFLGLRARGREKFLTVVWLLLISSVTLYLVHLVSVTYQINIAYIFHTYTAVEFALLALFYHELLKSFRLRRYIRITIISFLAYKVVDTLWITTTSNVDQMAISIESLLVLLFIFLYFTQLFREKTIRRVLHHPTFWINNANLFYFVGILVFSISHFFQEDVLWSGFHLHNYLLLLRNVLFTLAFWFAYRNSRVKSVQAISRK